MRIMLRIDRNPIWKIVRAFLAGFVLGPFAFGLILGPGEYLPDLITELMGIGVTVLVIDWLYELRGRRELKHRLVREVGSGSNEFAKNAVSWLRAEGWLQGDDGLLKGKYLHGANLNGVDLRGANLQSTSLLESKLRNAKLEGANLHKAMLNEAELQEVSLSGAIMTKCFLFASKLQGANMRYTKLQSAILMKAKLQGAEMTEAKLQGANLKWANLQRAKLGGANLQGAYLRGAELEGAVWRYGSFVGPEESEYSQSIPPAVLPDGTTYTEDIDMGKFTDHWHREFDQTIEKIEALRNVMGLD